MGQGPTTADADPFRAFGLLLNEDGPRVRFAGPTLAAFGLAGTAAGKNNTTGIAPFEVYELS